MPANSEAQLVFATQVNQEVKKMKEIMMWETEIKLYALVALAAAVALSYFGLVSTYFLGGVLVGVVLFGMKVVRKTISGK